MTKTKYVLGISVVVIGLLIMGQVSGLNKKIFSYLDFNDKTKEITDGGVEKTKIVDVDMFLDNVKKDNQKRIVKYQKTIDNKNVHFDIYNDDDGNSYTFIDNKLTGYLKNKKAGQDAEKGDMSERDMAVKAKKVGSKILEQFNKYINDYKVKKVVYNKGYGEYEMTFGKYLNGYETNESFSISFNKQGVIENFSAHHIGKYDNIKADINKQEVDKYVKESIGKTYPNATYKVENQIINYVNNGYFLELDISINDGGVNKSTQLFYPIK